MDQILANLADAVPDTFTDVSGEEAELPGEINDVMQVRYQSCVNKHMSHCHMRKKILTEGFTTEILCPFMGMDV